MGALQKLQDRIRQKGLKHTARSAFRRYVFSHRQLLWMERDLVSPVPPCSLKDHPPVTCVVITTANADAFARHFGNRVETMRELAAEGHTGHMYVDEQGDAIGFIWGSMVDYHDRHFYRCTFAVKPGEFFEFGGEMIRRYFGSQLSVTAQVALWDAMRAKGCNKVVDVVDNQNVPAMKLHLRMGYQEQGRIMHVYRLFGRWHLFRQSRYEGSRLEELRKPDVERTLRAV